MSDLFEKIKLNSVKHIKELGVPLLAQIPLVMDVGETAELGQPVYARNNKVIIQAFDSLAASIAEKWPADSENTDS